MTTIRDNPAEHRFELDIENGHMAVLYYRLAPGVITLTHTETPPQFTGRGIASRLVHEVLQTARARGLKVVPQCAFVAAYIGKHPEFADLLK